MKATPIVFGLAVLLAGTAGSACSSKGHSPSALANHVNEACTAWAADVEKAAAAYDEYGQSNVGFDQSAGRPLPFGRTKDERTLAIIEVDQRLRFCRRVPREATTAQIDKTEVDAAQAVKAFGLADDPKAAASALHRVAEVSKAANTARLRDE